MFGAQCGVPKNLNFSGPSEESLKDGGDEMYNFESHLHAVVIQLVAIWKKFKFF